MEGGARAKKLQSQYSVQKLLNFNPLRQAYLGLIFIKYRYFDSPLGWSPLLWMWYRFQLLSAYLQISFPVPGGYAPSLTFTEQIGHYWIAKVSTYLQVSKILLVSIHSIVISIPDPLGKWSSPFNFIHHALQPLLVKLVTNSTLIFLITLYGGSSHFRHILVTTSWFFSPDMNWEYWEYWEYWVKI